MVASITSYDAITDKAFEQDWALDATGNWDGCPGPPPFK